VGPSVSDLTYKSRAKWKMLREIYSAICGEVNVSVSVCVEIKGDYIEKQQICFIYVTLKSWLGRKLLDPPSYVTYFEIRILVHLPSLKVCRCYFVPSCAQELGDGVYPCLVSVARCRSVPAAAFIPGHIPHFTPRYKLVFLVTV